MAFTSRAVRQTGLDVSRATTDKVGPGSYSADWSHTVDHAHAPFSSTSEREVGFMANTVTPGPGTYNNAPRQKNPNLINSTAPRWRPSKYDTEAPGPGTYSIPSGFRAKRPKSSQGGGGVTGKNNPVWFRSPTAPSIPVPAQAHGYEETPTGELVRQPPPVKGFSGKGNDRVGPGAYNVVESASALKPSKATNFGRSKTTRITDKEIATKAELPGPGQYDWGQQEQPPKLKKPTATFVSRVLRAHQKEPEEDTAPGPGDYNSHYYHAIKTRHVPEVLQCFGSTSRRGTDVTVVSKVPGPGSYKDSRTAFETLKKKPLQDASRAPFASSASRFRHSSSDVSEKPGPGAYDAASKQSFIAELQRTKFGRGGHFGSTSRRFEPAKKDKEDDKPGPGAYESKEPKQVAGTLRKGPSSVFASSSNRFKGERPVVEKNPGPAPGQYQTVKPWSVQRVSHSNAFIGTESRFKDPTAEAGAPGPGSYIANNYSIEARLVTQPERPAGFGTETRFKKKKADRLGPGSYDPVDPYGGLVKRSFNVTVESGLL